MWGKYYSNLQCFFYKKNYKAKFSTSSILKKKKRIILKKKSYKERKKIIQENIIAIHNVFLMTELNSQPV
jgi:hypothetical protein